MVEIEVGEYVRTTTGKIGTLIEVSKAGEGVRYAGEFITDTIVSIYTKPHTEVRVKDKYVTKHSKNIIDLIEVGDYVNGKCCVEIEENIADDGRRNLSLVCLGGSILELSHKIFSIVTKEQFKSMEYRVEE